MTDYNWKIEDLLMMGESLAYKCEIENDGNTIPVFITNYRIIWINGAFVDCRMLRFISKYGVFVGYDDYVEDFDIGNGEYGVYFGDLQQYETMWFCSEKVWKSFYGELSRAILEAC